LTERANEQVVLEKVLDQKREKVAPQLEPDDFFEVFACEQVLKSFDLSYEEIEQGIVGGGNDGGIDALFAASCVRAGSPDPSPLCPPSA
jgi:hypothetical protein